MRHEMYYHCMKMSFNVVCVCARGGGWGLISQGCEKPYISREWDDLYRQIIIPSTGEDSGNCQNIII